MLKEQIVEKDIYKCNYCGRIFNIRDALLAKGNLYLCSMTCVLNYDKGVKK